MSRHRRLLRLNRRGGRLSALRRTASGGSADPVRSGGASSVLGRDAAPRRAFPRSGVERRRGWIGQLLGVRSTALRSSGGAVGACGRRGRWTRCSSVARRASRWCAYEHATGPPGLKFKWPGICSSRVRRDGVI
jgi:hypothetical protein